MPRKKRRNKRSEQQSNKIVSINASVKVHHRFRYEVQPGGGTSFSINRAALLNLMMVNTTGAKLNARLIAGVKLKRIEITSSPTTSVSTTFTACSIEWLSNYGPSTQISDMPSSSMTPARITSSPPRNSLSSFWSLTGLNETEVLFKMILGTNQHHVIDVWVDIVMMDDETPVLLTTNNIGTIYQFYLGYLDGLNGFIVPVSYSSLT
jgi:hypothetical protein